MTVAIGDRKTVWAGDGTADPRNTTFIFYDNDEVVIWHLDGSTAVLALLTEGAGNDYTLTGGAGAVGVVTPTAVIANGDSWIGYRVTKHDQETPFSTGGRFPAGAHERALDRAAAARQDLDDDRLRSMRAPVTDDDTYKDMELPVAADRVSTVAGYDANGQPICIVGSIDSALISVTAVGQAIAEFATIAEVIDYISLLTTRGDIITAGASGIEQRLALGSDGDFLMSDGTDAVWDTPSAVTIPLPRGYQAGCILSPGATPDEEINVSPGAWRDSSDSYNLLVPSQLVIDNKTTGVALGVFDAAGVQADTEYHVFLIRKTSDGSVSAGLDTTENCASIPAGYVEYRRIGTRFTDGTSDFLQMIQDGDRALFQVPWKDLDDSGDHSSEQTAALSVPIGFPVVALLRVSVSSSAAGDMEYIYGASIVGAAPHVSNAPLATVCVTSASSYDMLEIEVETDDAGQIHYRSDDADVDLRIVLLGWLDTRGRDD